MSLLTNVQVKRKDHSQNVFIPNEANARELYRLQLEVTVVQLIKNAIINAGPYHWAVTDAKSIFNRVFSPALNQCVGAFHGPETHPSGYAPFHWHYNVGVIGPSGTLINAHIFYDSDKK